MINLIKVEVKKSLDKKFLLALMILIGTLMIGVFEYYNGKVLLYNDNNAIHCFLAVIENNMVLLPSLTILITSIACGDSLYKEYKNGHIRNIVSRITLKKYLIAKIISNSIIAFMVVAIPMIILLGVSLILFDFDKSILSDSSYYGPYGQLGAIYQEQPIVYLLISIFFMGIFGVVYSTISFGISLWTKYRAIVLIAPVVIYNIFQFIIDTIGAEVAINTVNKPMSGLLFVIFEFNFMYIGKWYILILATVGILTLIKIKRGIVI